MLPLFSEPQKIKTLHKDKLADPENEVLVSAVPTWKVLIKVAIGKLSLPDGQDPSFYLPISVRRASLTAMSITPEHTYGVACLAKHHADPFDRLLISQAKIEVAHDRDERSRHLSLRRLDTTDLNRLRATPLKRAFIRHRDPTPSRDRISRRLETR
jgi:PIN domain nuclease of toxin-antitoxin system